MTSNAVAIIIILGAAVLGLIQPNAQRHESRPSARIDRNTRGRKRLEAVWQCAPLASPPSSNPYFEDNYSANREIIPLNSQIPWQVRAQEFSSDFDAD